MPPPNQQPSPGQTVSPFCYKRGIYHPSWWIWAEVGLSLRADVLECHVEEGVSSDGEYRRRSNGALYMSKKIINSIINFIASWLKLSTDGAGTKMTSTIKIWKTSLVFTTRIMSKPGRKSWDGKNSIRSKSHVNGIVHPKLTLRPSKM